MPEKFLIEVPHEANTVECARVVDVFLKSGSHFLSGPVWGCRDGVHKAWMIVDVDSKEEARGIIPPLLRAKATIVHLNSFTVQEIEDILREHGALGEGT